MTTGWRFLVSGDVQGVGYRRFVQRAATGLGVSGRVRNLPDGRVEVAAWGTPPAIEELAERLAAGSLSAKVTKVERTEILGEWSSVSGFAVVS